jgi:signal peptidase I
MEFAPPVVSDAPVDDKLARALNALVRQALQERGLVCICLHGDSMWPAIPAGSVVDVQRISAADIRLGDVVVWQKGPDLIAHRVVQKVRSDAALLLRTRGDNCADCDQLLSPQQVLGRITGIRQGQDTPRRATGQPSPEAVIWVTWWHVRSFLSSVGRILPVSIRRPLVWVRDRTEHLLSQGVAKVFLR